MLLLAPIPLLLLVLLLPPGPAVLILSAPLVPPGRRTDSPARAAGSKSQETGKSQEEGRHRIGARSARCRRRRRGSDSS